MIRIITFVFLAVLAISAKANEDRDLALPDFSSDRFNTVKDYLTGKYLTPQLPGEVFEWPTVSPVDWNNDGLYDLLVGYNLRKPDVIRMVVFINQGIRGKPAFTGKSSPDTCFYLQVKYPDESSYRIFEGDGYDVPHHPHKFLVHQTAPMDFDNDGLFDILLNEGTINPERRRGQWYLHNIGKAGQPKFEAYYLHKADKFQDLPDGPYIQALEMFLIPPFESRLQSFSMVDWNSDGVADFQYSASSTYVMFGTLDDNGAWSPRDDDWIEQKPINKNNFGTQPHMATADFNFDGVNELLIAHPFSQENNEGFFSLFVQSKNQPGVFVQRTWNIFSLNSESNPWLYPDLSWPFIFAKHGWWHPRISAFDYDEDGDIDVVAGWGGGNDQRQYGNRMYLYRSN